MRIRKRLVLSNIAMILIPLLLIAVTGVLFRFIFDWLPSGSGWNRTTMSGGSGHAWLQSDQLLAISRALAADPQFFQDADQARLFEQSLGLPGRIAVSRDGQVLYASQELDAARLVAALTNSGPTKARGLFRVASLVIPIPAGEVGGPVGPAAPRTETLLHVLVNGHDVIMAFALPGSVYVLLVAVILMLTNGSLAWVVARSIVVPLSALEAMALRIRDGDLSGHGADRPQGCSPLCRLVCSPRTGASDDRCGGDEFDGAFAAFNEMRQRLKESLEKQLAGEESRRELIAAISHDLRTPLAAIKGYAEGLRDGVAAQPDKARDYLQTILAKTALMDRLIEDLFLFSRLGMDGFPWDRRIMDLGSFIMECMTELAADFPALRVLVEPLPGACRMALDAPRLRRVFANIVQNAAAYAVPADGGQAILRVGLQHNGSNVLVTFSDNGPGLPAGLEERIFERFYRADPSRGGIGAGLGLAIARLIVNGHGGSIHAGNLPDGGARFVIELPLDPP
jgi:signal transduction histidine kinase